MSHRLRSSKYRHVYTEGPKNDDIFTNIVPYPGGGDHQGIKCNTKYWATGVKGGGGPVLVHPLDKPGVVPTEAVRLNGHTADVLDLDFHPFYQDLLVTGSQDCRINLWRIPEGGPQQGQEPIGTMQGCKKKVMYTLFNPVADNILATADGSKVVNIFDVQTSQLVLSNKDHTKLIQDLKWNGDGSQLCTASKDRALRFFDPRAPESTTVVPDVHKGLKTFKMCFLDNHNQYVTVGFNRQARRELKTFDARTNKVVNEHALDQSSGLLFPFYDQGTNLLYLIGRGDSNIRIFERTSDAPYQYECSNERVSGAVKGVCMVPKRCLDVLNTETTRFVKMTSDQVQVIHYTIPRRDAGFQEDLFPDDYAGIPGLNAEQWLGGDNAKPVLMSLDPDNRSDEPAAAAKFEQKEAPSSDDPAAAEEAGKRRNAVLEKQIKEANAKIKELEEKRRVLNGKIAKKEKEAEEAEVEDAMAQVRPGLEESEEEEDNEKWEAEEEAAPAPAPAPAAEAEAEPLPAAAAPEGCKNPELYNFLAGDAVQMANLYDKFVEGGVSSIEDLQDIDSVDEFVTDFGLKKAQARKIMKALK